MAEDEGVIFSNLPRRRGERDDDDDERARNRAHWAMRMSNQEGPLPPRPRPSGKGGPSLGASNTPPILSGAPVVTGIAAVGQTLACDHGLWYGAPTGYAYQWLRDGANIGGATSATYVVVSGDLTHAISCKVTATNANGSTPATSNALTIVALPANTTAPVISGSLTVGSTLSCTTGTWSNSPTSYAYQWMRGASNISGATSATYVTVTADGGTSLTCVVTATNAAGSASATSNALSIAAAPTLPVNTVAPVASGTATVGSTLSCTAGTWTGSPTPTYAYQWLRNGTNISGATSSTYVTVTADGGTSVSCTVTATNTAGGASATSNAISVAAAVASSVWSATDAAANSMTLTNGGLTFAPTTTANGSIRGTVSKTSGKLYVEFLANATNSADYIYWGLASSGFTATGALLGTSNYSGGVRYGTTSVSTGFTANYYVQPVPAVNDVISLAIDFMAGSIWVAQNNVWLNGSNPATGSLPILSFVPGTVGALFPAMSTTSLNETWTLQPTAASQKYAPPSGFSAWG